MIVNLEVSAIVVLLAAGSIATKRHKELGIVGYKYKNGQLVAGAARSLA
jgi:hypothetical protein